MKSVSALALGALLFAGSASAVPLIIINVPATVTTIQAAINEAPTRATVLVAPGTYYENLDFKGKAITVKSSGGAAVTILDGNGSGPIVNFHSGESRSAVLEGFTLTHAATSSGGSAIAITSSSPSIADNVFVDDDEGNLGAVISGDAASPAIVRNYFSANTCADADVQAYVVGFVDASSPVIADNVFANNPCAALMLDVPTDASPQVYNNTFVGNSIGLSLSLSSDSSTMLFSNNIIAFNQYGLDVAFSDGATLPTWSHNLVYGDTTADYQGVASQTGTDGNISVDPLLTDWATGDVHIASDSPAIDVGDSSVTQTSSIDFYHDPRVVVGVSSDDAVVDIGAVEYFVAPVITATDAAYSTEINTAISGTLASTGEYAGEAVKYSLVTLPTRGAVTFLSATSGAFQYTPNSGYLGSDSFTFEATDPYGTASNAATVQLTMQLVDPVANDGAVDTVAGTAASGTLTASTASSGQTLSFAIVANPLHGMVSLDSVTGQFQYTPAQGYIGADSFTFQATDQYGARSNIATVQVGVVVPITIHVPVDQPTIQAAIDAATYADTVLVAPGTYDEKLDFEGKTITVKSSGGAAVTILDGQQSGPIVTFHSGETNAAVLQGFTLTHAVDDEAAGGAVSLSNKGSPTIEDNVFVDNVDELGGSAISGDATSAVILRNYFAGNSGAGTEADLFCVVDIDGFSSPVVADNVFVNNSAVAYCGEYGLATSAQIYNNTMVGNSGGLNFSADGFGAGTLFKNNLISFNQVGVDIILSGTTLSGIFADNLVYGNTTADYRDITSQTGTAGNISSDPRLKDWADGDVHLQYGSPAIDVGDSTVSQSSSTDVSGNARVAVGMPGDASVVDIGALEYTPPSVTAAAGSVTVLLSAGINGTLGSMGADPGEPLVFALSALPVHGVVTLTDASTGAFQYTPAAGYLGSDSFTFKITDPYGTVSNAATEQLIVKLAPTANNGSAQTKVDSAGAGMLSATPAYPGTRLTFSVASNAPHGIVTVTPANGRFNYVPAAGYAGTDSFSFKVTDSLGSTAVATERLTVTDIVPIAHNANIVVLGQKTYTGSLPVTSAYTEQALRFQLVSPPRRGTVIITNVRTGAYTYSANSGLQGTDSFTVQTVDQYGTASSVATVSVKIL